ncbi:MAG: DUF3106 domain-containing protein [Rubrivivax sp.]|nr:DUF3106 domain-containing protein [Rubrivivax sp.]
MPLPWRLLLVALLPLWLVSGHATPEAPPRWAALTATQQQALAPLREHWSRIDAERKQKWLQMADRFARLPASERERLQDRMADWARLSPEQRARARLQYQETRRLPPDERQAHWEAYQALTEDERRALAERRRSAERAARSTADARRSGSGKRHIVQPVAAPPRKVVAPTVVQAGPGATTLPVTRRAAPPVHHQAGLPKVAATPGFVDKATLLPQRGPQGAAVESRPAPRARPPASSPDAAPDPSP